MKKKVLIDVKIICDEPRYLSLWSSSVEERTKSLEGWIKEFHNFIRDHRSQDPVYLSVEREYQDQCSFCGLQWEEEGNGQPCCCNKAVLEWEHSRLLGL